MASATATASTRAIISAALSTTTRCCHRLSSRHYYNNNNNLTSRHLLPSPSCTSFGSGSSSSRSFSNTSRTMSSIPAGKCEWLVVVPDKPGKLAQRLEVRAQHLAGIKPQVEAGFLKTGGAILNEKPEGTDASKFDFYGSTLVCIASSKEEILENLRKDIYTTSGVWDLDNVQIWAAKFAL